MSSIYIMSGYETQYGEDIRKKIMEDNLKYINHYDNFENVKLDLTYGQFSGSAISKPTYTGETTAPKDITQTELEKEMEFQGEGKKEYYGEGMSGGFGRFRIPTSRKSRAFSSKGHEAVLDVADEVSDVLPLSQVAKMGIQGLRMAKDWAKSRRAGRGQSGGEMSGGITRPQILKEVMKVKKQYDAKMSGGKTRAQIVKEVMKERGCSLPQASKIVKEEGLYQGKGKSGGGRSGGRKRTLGQQIKEGIQTGKKVVETGKKVGSVVKDIANLIPNENAKKLAGLLGAFGMGRSGGMKKYKRAEWNKMMDSVEDDKLKKGFKKYKKGMKYGGGCDVCEMNKYLEGKGFWEDFGRGFMSVIKPVASVAKAVLPVVAPGVGTAAALGMNAIGLGKSGGKKKEKKDKKGKEDPVIEKLLGGELIVKTNKGSSMSGGGVSGGGVSGGKKKRKTSDKMKKRGELVKKIMKERGVKLAEASKIIKSEGLM